MTQANIIQPVAKLQPNRCKPAYNDRTIVEYSLSKNITIENIDKNPTIIVVNQHNHKTDRVNFILKTKISKIVHKRNFIKFS